jgi:serine protease AprX
MERVARVRFPRVVAAILLFAVLTPLPSSELNAATSWLDKLDPLVRRQVGSAGRSRLVVRAVSGDAVASVLRSLPLLGGRLVRSLSIIDAAAIDLPNSAVPIVAANPLVARVSADRVVAGAMDRTGAAVGAAAVRRQLGFDGAGIGVAVVDSGVTPWHDDLSAGGGGQRVDRFVDFTAGRSTAYDDDGHGTHVAGIVAGNGFDSSGARAGIAPGAHLVVLKVLDASGRGRISDVIAALGHVVSNRAAFNIRVVNLSIATGVYESYDDDPLTLAARQAVGAGIVVVAAAGNYGRGPDGLTRYGGITAPGNAPWVLTVGASSHMGTADRADDAIAPFSSRGPTAIDRAAKPDLVAPGVGIESLSNPASRLYAAGAAYLLDGTVATPDKPYMSLSGTSMAAPVVAGTVALMLQANPSLTPESVKGILQYTSQPYPGYDTLTQGAGFLNARGAVELAAYLASPATTAYPDSTGWSGRVLWGTRAIAVSALDLLSLDTAVSPSCGALCSSAPGTTGVSSSGTPEGDTVVWGTWSGEGDTVVWGTWSGEGDTVVWGTSAQEGDTVVWGTSCADPSCEPVVWHR